jgi:taurine dioxygenase
MVKRLRGLKVIYKHRNQSYNPDPLSCHPLLCTHPDSRKKFLFVSSSSAQRIKGMGLEESQSLLDSLFVHTTQDKFVWEHKWSKGDIIVWDNRTTLHRRNSLDSNQRRIMYRTQILGPLTI